MSRLFDGITKFRNSAHYVEVIPVYPGADTWEGNAFRFVHFCEIQTRLIAACQQLRGRLYISKIDWPNGMDDFSRSMSAARFMTVESQRSQREPILCEGRSYAPVSLASPGAQPISRLHSSSSLGPAAL